MIYLSQKYYFSTQNVILISFFLLSQHKQSMMSIKLALSKLIRTFIGLKITSIIFLIQFQCN